MSDFVFVSGEGIFKTLSERAYRAIREDIISGALEPGLKLKIEMLRQRYDCGAGPLREALSRLAGDHLVSFIEQRGFVVAPISIQDARDIGALRQQLEGDALAQSIENSDTAWEERVITTHHRLERIERRDSREPADLVEWERCNFAFHEALVAACKSSWLLRLRDMMYKQHERYRRISRMKTAPTRDIRLEHLALRDAALERDVDLAVSLIRTHVQRTTEAVAASLENKEGGT